MKICLCFINNYYKNVPKYLSTIFKVSFKFFQKLPSDNIFINCTNLSKLVKTVFDAYLNFIKLLNICKILVKFTEIFLSNICKISKKQVQNFNKFLVKFTQILLFITYSSFLNLVYTSAPLTRCAVRMWRILVAGLINFPWTWSEQRTPNAWKGDLVHPVLFLFAQETDKFWFTANSMQTVRRWRSAGLQSRPHICAFGSQTVRERFANHSACSCIQGFKNFLIDFQNSREVFPNRPLIFFQNFNKYNSKLIIFLIFAISSRQFLSHLFTFYQLFCKNFSNYFSKIYSESR